MSYRDVLAILTSSREEPVLRAAELAAGRTDGRITALQAFEMPVIVAADGPGAIAIWPQVIEQTRADAKAEGKRIQQQLKALEVNSELRVLETPLGLAGEWAGQHAMHADISVIQAPHSELGWADQGQITERQRR